MYFGCDRVDTNIPLMQKNLSGSFQIPFHITAVPLITKPVFKNIQNEWKKGHGHTIPAFFLDLWKTLGARIWQGGWQSSPKKILCFSIIKKNAISHNLNHYYYHICVQKVGKARADALRFDFYIHSG